MRKEDCWVGYIFMIKWQIDKIYWNSKRSTHKHQRIALMHRFVLEIVTGVYDNGSPALISWLAFLTTFHAIVVIVFFSYVDLLWKIKLSLSRLKKIRDKRTDMLLYGLIRRGQGKLQGKLQHVTQIIFFNSHHGSANGSPSLRGYPRRCSQIRRIGWPPLREYKLWCFSL